jgi:uncharacterized membrane protein
MPIHFESRWNKLREGFWFLPSTLIIAGFLLGNFMIRLDERSRTWSTEHLSWLFPGNAEWAKAFFTTLASSIAAATILIISTTIIALTLASQQFGPRLLRNFLRDSTTKSILGIFFGTGVFGFVIRFRVDENFIPYLSIAFMGGLSMVDMFLLILFVHHISISIHSSNVMAVVSRDYSHAVEKLFPQKLLETPLSAQTPLQKADLPRDFEKETRPIDSNESGYIQNIDYEYLLGLAQEKDIILKIHLRPGEFIIEDTPLAYVWPGSAYDETLFKRVNDSIYLGNERTLTQDVEFAINQLVEIAVRALSPAINDPFSATRCLNRLAQGLVELAHSQMPSPYLYDSNQKLRLIIKTITFPMMVDASFNLIRQNGLNSPVVLIALLEGLGLVAPFVQSEEDRAVLRLHAEMVERGCQKTLSEEFDRNQVKAAYQALLKKLTWNSN